MIKKLCIFTISFAFNRQIMLNFLEKIIPKETELFLFVPKECIGKFSSSRIKIYESKKSKFNCLFDLRTFCRQNKIDRIFTLGALPQEGFIISFASMFTKTEPLCHLVVNPFTAYKTGFNKPALKAFFEFLLLYPMMLFVKKFYVPVKDIYEKSMKTFFYAKSKIEFLKYPTDTVFFKQENKKQCRKKLNILQDKKVVLYVGRVEYEKGSDILLKLAKMNTDILFIFIGQIFDKNFENLQMDNLKLLGPKDRSLVKEYYNAADLCIFTSRSDAGPSTARESMACGTQVILSDIMGSRMLSPPAIKSQIDVQEINKKMKEFFSLSEKQRKDLSQKLRLFVDKEYSEQECKKFYIDKLTK